MVHARINEFDLQYHVYGLWVDIHLCMLCRQMKYKEAKGIGYSTYNLYVWKPEHFAEFFIESNHIIEYNETPKTHITHCVMC
jgi:hypothetical protein